MCALPPLQSLIAKSKSIEGIQQFPFRAVAQALEVIPRTLIENCGGNPIKLLTALRAKHAAAITTGSTSTWGDEVCQIPCQDGHHFHRECVNRIPSVSIGSGARYCCFFAACGVSALALAASAALGVGAVGEDASPLLFHGTTMNCPVVGSLYCTNSAALLSMHDTNMATQQRTPRLTPVQKSSAPGTVLRMRMVCTSPLMEMNHSSASSNALGGSGIEAPVEPAPPD